MFSNILSIVLLVIVWFLSLIFFTHLVLKFTTDKGLLSILRLKDSLNKIEQQHKIKKKELENKYLQQKHELQKKLQTEEQQHKIKIKELEKTYLQQKYKLQEKFRTEEQNFERK